MTTNAFAAIAANIDLEGDSLDRVAIAYANANKAGKTEINNGLQAAAMAALQAGDMEAAAKWATLMRDVVTAADGVADDYDAAKRVATFRAVLADMEIDLSDRARDLVESGTVGACDRLAARLAGVNVTRTSVSDDGAKRAASDEPKGSVKDAMVACLDAHLDGEWVSIADMGKWITANGAAFGYTPDYVVSGGAILARNADNDRARAWRAENGIEFAKVDMGKAAPIWCVRRNA